MNKLKKGLTYISERTDQLRYSDKLTNEKWLQPLSEYIPLERIMRGQPVSIANVDDLKRFAKVYDADGTFGLENELLKSSQTFIVLTNPAYHTHSVGLAYEYSAGILGDESGRITCPDPIHVLGQGKFNIDLDYLIKSKQKTTDQIDREVINKTEYIPDFLNDYEKNIGKPIWVNGSAAGKLTIDKDEAFTGYRNIIQIGFISDAWVKDSPENGKYSSQATIEVQIDGDGRGALDATLFEGILGEDVIIPSNDPVRVFALGQESDEKFSGRINITPLAIKNLDPQIAYIGLQKMDGRTALITFDSNVDTKFNINQAKKLGTLEDASFLAVAEAYIAALSEASKSATDISTDDGIKIISIPFPDTKDKSVDEIKSVVTKTRTGLQKALLEAYKFISKGENLLCEDLIPVDANGGFIKFEAENPGGYYYMHICEKESQFFKNSQTFNNGSYDNKGYVVLADTRIPERQNLIGIYYSGDYDQLLTKNTKCIFMHDGLFLPHTFKYDQIGKTYYLGTNGRVTPVLNQSVDTITKILDVQDNNKLLIHCGDSRVRSEMDDLPVGYIKPAIYDKEGQAFYAEYGFVLMDGSRISYKDHDLLYTRLTNWYKEEDLNRGKLEGETEDYFTVPKATSATAAGAESILQIKAIDVGIYENEPKSAYVRRFGEFEKSGQFARITLADEGEDSPHEIKAREIGNDIPLVGRYFVTMFDQDGEIVPQLVNGENVAHRLVDSRIDISPVCHFSTFKSQKDLPSIETLDIHLYVNLDDNDTDMVEILPGFHPYNNTTSYGFQWKIERDLSNVNADHALGTFKLSTDIKDGMGIYYLSGLNGAPVSVAGRDWKIVVGVKPSIRKQFDLDGIMEEYISHKINEANTDEFGVKAVTGEAVIEAIENRVNVRTLIARADSDKVKSEILLGRVGNGDDTIDGPATTLHLNAVNKIPVHSKTGIEFDVSSDANPSEVKVEINEENQFEIVAKTTPTGEPYDIPKLNGMKPNAFVTRRQVEEHSAANAIDVSTNNDKEGISHIDHAEKFVHGLHFGKKGNVDATMVCGLSLKVHHDIDIASLDNGSFSDKSYIPIRTFGSAPLYDKESERDNKYINYNEGYTVNYKDAVMGQATSKVYTGSTYREEVEDGTKKLDNVEFINDDYKVFSTTKMGKNNEGVKKYIRTKYNFSTTSRQSNPSSFDSSNIYDIEFQTKTSESGAWNPAAIKVGAIGVTSRLKYKNVYGEDYQRTGYEEASGVFTDGIEWHDEDHDNNLGKHQSEETGAHEYMGSALQALYEMPVALWQYNHEPSWYKKYLGIVIERVHDVGEKLNSETSERDIFDRLAVGQTQAGDNSYKYTAEEIESIKRYFNLITDNAESAQNIISSVGMLLRAAKETQDRMLKLEVSTFGADAPTVPGDKPAIKLEKLPGVVQDPTHLGLNRLVRAMAQELYGTANPLDDLKGDNDTTTSLSRIDELEEEIEGKTFENEKTSSSNNNFVDVDSATYPYEVSENAKSIENITENFDPISGRKAKEGEDEDKADGAHGTWTKVDYEKPQSFEGGLVESVANNLTKETERHNFNGAIDAIGRICTKVNALTYAINGVDNINSSPRRLNTIRQNIETLIQEAYFDGEPTTSLQGDSYITTDATKAEALAYCDDNVDTQNEIKQQPSAPYKPTSSRFDELSNILYNYVIDGFNEKDLTVNEFISSKQYTTADDKDKGTDTVQVITNRTFNGKPLLISGMKTPEDVEFRDPVAADLNTSTADGRNISEVKVNVPDSIEEYQYASIIDLLLDLIGGNFRYESKEDNYDGTEIDTNKWTERNKNTILGRLSTIESALDKVVRKLDNNPKFEEVESDVNGKPPTEIFSIERYIEILRSFLGANADETTELWGTSSSAEVAAKGKYNDNITDPFKYLENNEPVINANYIIKQLLLRVKQEEAKTDWVETILGPEYLNGIRQTIYTPTENNPELIQDYRYEENFHLWDDIKDLLLTIYGKDPVDESTNSELTVVEHRTKVTDSNSFVVAYAWKSDANPEVVYSKKENVSSGDEVFTSPIFDTVRGNITKVDYGSEKPVITVNPGPEAPEYPSFRRDAQYDVSSSNDGAQVRFAGDSKNRNLIDDIVHELYYVPNVLQHTDKDAPNGGSLVDGTKDSASVNYNEYFYDLDSADKHYDYEGKVAGDDNRAAIGKAIGYGNRSSLFRDFQKDPAEHYRRTRIEVLEDEIRHLRQLLGLNLITKDTKDMKQAIQPVYQGMFLENAPGELGGHKFETGATRTTGAFAGHEDSSLLQMLFNLESAFIDLNKELGKESTALTGGETDSSNNIDDEATRNRKSTIYSRLEHLEEITDTILGIEEDDTPGSAEEDDNGVLDIKWF